MRSARQRPGIHFISGAITWCSRGHIRVLYPFMSATSDSGTGDHHRLSSIAWAVMIIR